MKKPTYNYCSVHVLPLLERVFVSDREREHEPVHDPSPIHDHAHDPDPDQEFFHGPVFVLDFDRKR